jgi:hypothetical protein
MSATTAPVAVRSRRSSYAVLRALTTAELRRSLRTPVLPAGAAAAVWYLWTITPATEAWSGSAYNEMAIASAPLLAVISWAAARSFHRERTAVAVAAPVREGIRAAARLLAALPLVASTVGFAALVAWRQRELGGLTLGAEPGRTSEALHSLPELAQHVALGVLAVALGAALGRRLPRLVLALPALLVLWFTVSGLYWLFGSRQVTPFSVVQVQPIAVPVGDATADPLSFPATWLLEGPGDFRDGWARLFVSTELAWWHCGWLMGLSAVLLAVAVPAGTARRVLLLGGAALAVAAAVVQVQVIP